MNRELVASYRSDRSTVVALEHAWDPAPGRGNVEALAAIFDNSLVYVDYDGTLFDEN